MKTRLAVLRLSPPLPHHLVPQLEPGDELPKDEKLLVHAALRAPAPAVPGFMIAQHLIEQLHQFGFVGRIPGQPSVNAVADLVAGPAGLRVRQNRHALPHSLGHREAEPFAKRVLYDDRRAPLQRAGAP